MQTPDSPCTEVKPTVEAGEPEAAAERSTTPVELLWDLVFVFAVTQVTTLLSHDLSWSGLGRAMLVLALMWWAWSAFVWATNAQDPDALTFRVVLLVATALIFIVGVAVPHAFGRDGTLLRRRTRSSGCCTSGSTSMRHVAVTHRWPRSQGSRSPSQSAWRYSSEDRSPPARCGSSCGWQPPRSTMPDQPG